MFFLERCDLIETLFNIVLVTAYNRCFYDNYGKFIVLLKSGYMQFYMFDTWEQSKQIFGCWKFLEAEHMPSQLPWN